MLGQSVSVTRLNLLGNDLPFNMIYKKSDWSGKSCWTAIILNTIVHINWCRCRSILQVSVEDSTLLSTQTPNSCTGVVEFLICSNVPFVKTVPAGLY